MYVIFILINILLLFVFLFYFVNFSPDPSLKTLDLKQGKKKKQPSTYLVSPQDGNWEQILFYKQLMEKLAYLLYR